ncbi:TetR/AcrR family transcriptional regulator [Streptomyces coerulescens]|uniref:TetR/AcrR family transcriptional regulator n=1 Tax=Streptomyces coerulescens TaxID=29304 RepID=A0ABW0CWS0_STRCD
MTEEGARSGRAGTSERAAQLAQRRAELLEATRKVVIQRGWSSTRVADVAKEADVSPGLVHYHFDNLSELLTEMLRVTAEAEARQLRVIADGPGTVIARLDRVLRHYVPRTRSDQTWMLWLDAWAGALREQSLRSIIRELDGAWVAVIERLIGEGVAEGLFSCDDPGAAAERLDALLDGLAVRYTLNTSKLSARRFLEHARVAAAREVGLDRSDFPRSR